MDLKSVFKKIISEQLNELDTATYGKIANGTAHGYYHQEKDPDAHRYNPNARGNKLDRVNDLARERFLQEFYKEYPKDSTKILTNKGEYSFIGIKLLDGLRYVDFNIYFQSENNKYLEIKSNVTDDIRYGLNQENCKIIDPRSIQLIKNMLMYNGLAPNSLTRVHPKDLKI